MIQLTVPAKRLRVGDRCRGSGALVTAPPVPSGHPGKVALTVTYTRRDQTRRERRAVWNARTTIGIDRPDLSAELGGRGLDSVRETE